MKNVVLAVLGTAAVLIATSAIGAKASERFTDEQVCRATIGAIMGRDPKIIRVDQTRGDDIYVSYIRSDDLTEWYHRCRIDITRVYWATASGRWRVDPRDEVITYATTPTTLTIHQKFNDGSSSTKSFTHAQLRAK